jgi:hypothetical protein
LPNTQAEVMGFGAEKDWLYVEVIFFAVATSSATSENGVAGNVQRSTQL